MPVAGAQRYMRAGSRVYFQRDPVSGVLQGLQDLGTIKTANPVRATQDVDLYDGDGGALVLVASAQTQITETYDIVTNNFSPANLSLLFAALPPSAYTISAGQVTATMVYGGPGTHLKLVNASGVPVYDVTDVVGFYSAAELQGTVTAINNTAKTIAVTDVVGTFDDLTLPSHVIVSTTGLANPDNAGTYAITAVSGTAPSLTLTYDPSVKDAVAAESAITGVVVGSALPAGAVLRRKTEWDVDTLGLRRGIVRILDTAAIPVAGNVTGIYRAKAITGKRLINPQTVQGELKGNVYIHWSEDNFQTELVREARASVTPGTTNIRVEDWSEATLRIKLLADLTAVSQPAGRLLQYAGTLPAGV